MASLRRFPRSPFWFACFTLPDGKRVQRSTKEKTRKAAQTKADEWEKFSKDRSKARQAHRVIAEIYKQAHKSDLPDATPRAYTTGWLQRRKNEIAPKSFESYAGRVKDFIEWMGEAADRPLAELEASNFIAYRDAVAATRSATTVNHGIKVLRSIFEDARRDGFIGDNPVKDCGLLKQSKRGVVHRRPFTEKELSRVLQAADAEWSSIILFGLYTGQRLGDVARLSWANVDVQAKEICIQTRKTGRIVRIPIAGPLASHIKKLPSGDAHSLIHPRAAAHAEKNPSTLSRQFSELLASVGLAEKRTHAPSKSGRSAQRTQAALTFHSLRHTATSMMKNAGVSPAIVQDIIGHESAEISAHYTHVDSEAKSKALATLPDFVDAK